MWWCVSGVCCGCYWWEWVWQHSCHIFAFLSALGIWSTGSPQPLQTMTLSPCRWMLVRDNHTYVGPPRKFYSYSGEKKTPKPPKHILTRGQNKKRKKSRQIRGINLALIYRPSVLTKVIGLIWQFFLSPSFPASLSPSLIFLHVLFYDETRVVIT